MELQAHLAAFQRAGIVLFAISYDSVEVLANFAEKYAITFPLLADVGSKVIVDLGLINRHLEAQARASNATVRDAHHGTPYPGTFFLDEAGIVLSKMFEQSYRVRPDATTVLASVTGIEPATTRPIDPMDGDPVSVQVRLDSATYRPYIKQRLIIDLSVANGFHIYGEPIPEGYQELSVTIDPVESLQTDPLQVPDAHPFRVAGLDDEFAVFEGSVRAVLPFYLEKNLGDIPLAVRVRYQACSETECFPPNEVMTVMQLTGLPLIRN